MRILYSKTHYKFNLRSGGSVAHMNGVVKAFANRATFRIVSNEPLYGLDAMPHVIVKPLLRSWYGEVLYNIKFMKAIRKVIREFNPDFVYHRFSGYSCATAKVCKQMKVPLILEYNSSDLWKNRYWSQKDLKAKMTNCFRLPILKILEPFIIRNAARIAVVSEPLKKSLIELGIESDKVFVNPNGVDTVKFKPETDTNRINEIMKKFNIPDRKIIVGFTGTYGPWHGIQDLLLAIKKVLSIDEWNDKIIFLLMGKGGPLYEKIFNELNNHQAVRFTGEIPFSEVQNYLAVCDILLSPHGKTPDNREFFGSPTKLFEYMAMGKGIVASRLGQIAEILVHEKNALLFEPGDVDGMVENIIRMASDNKLRRRLGDQARKTIMNQYTWDHNVQRTLEAYHAIKNSTIPS